MATTRNAFSGLVVEITGEVLKENGGSIDQEALDKEVFERVWGKLSPAQQKHFAKQHATHKIHQSQQQYREKAKDGLIYKPFQKVVSFIEDSNGTRQQVEVVHLFYGPVRKRNQAHDQRVLGLKDDAKCLNSDVTMDNRERVKKGIKPYIISKDEIRHALDQVNIGKPPEEEDETD